MNPLTEYVTNALTNYDVQKYGDTTTSYEEYVELAEVAIDAYEGFAFRDRRID